MCQPRPGPRCTAHAEAAVKTQRAALLRARATYDQAVAASVDERFPAEQRRETVARTRAVWLSEHARFKDVMRSYEETPGGQRSMRAAMDRLWAQGDHDGVREVAARLDEVQYVRKVRLEALSRMPVELAALDQASKQTRESARVAYVAWAETDVEVSRLTHKWDGLLTERQGIRSVDKAERTPQMRQDLARIDALLTQVADQTSAAMEHRETARERFRVAMNQARATSSAKTTFRTAPRRPNATPAVEGRGGAHPLVPMV